MYEDILPDKKASMIADLAELEHRELKVLGCIYKDGLLAWSDGESFSKQHLIHSLIASWGHYLKPSEIERELFPYIVALFHDGQVPHE